MLSFVCLSLLLFLLQTIDQTSATFVTQIPGECIPPKTWNYEKLDSEKLSGKWYYLLANSFDNGRYQRCMRDEVTPPPFDKEGWISQTTGLRGSGGDDYYKFLEIWVNSWIGSAPGRWKSYELTDLLNVGDNTRNGWIIAVDYDNYLVGYNCREDKYAGTYDAVLFAFSRAPTLCQDDWNTIMAKLLEADVLTGLTIFPDIITQTNCPDVENIVGPSFDGSKLR